ncbi:MAG: long-chain fatty acid--CoA ligase [Vicinamibacterales bacterium]
MSRAWTTHYDADVPASLAPYPERTLVDYLDEMVAEKPTHTAAIFKGARLSCKALADQSRAFAAALADLGVGRGDRVALVLPNTPQLLVAQYGIWRTGAIAVPLNPLYTPRELETALRGTTPAAVVTMTPYYESIRGLQAVTGVRHVIATSIKEYLPALTRVLFTLAVEKKGGHRVRLDPSHHWFGDLLGRHAGSAGPDVTVAPSDPAVILASGGTTGTPKGVLGTHRDYVVAGQQLRTWTRPAREDWTDIVMLPLPMFHVYANVGVQSLAIIGRNPLALVPNPRDINDVLATIQKLRPACFNGVPTLYNAILNHPKVKAGKVDLSSIKLCFSGAAPLLAETKKQFEAATGACIIEGYSLTEAMMATCINPVRGLQKPGSIGVPVSDVEVRIVDADNGDVELAPGEVGELILRAPQRMAGYWENPEETALVLREHGPGGPWVHTGDLAYRDTDGYLFIVDRKKDLIKVSGFQVWPREIEEVLATHPSVMEVGVAGVPDAARGEVPHAWVVLRPGHQATADELRAYCRERMTPYKVPAVIEFRDSLPKTLVGKILRRALRDTATGRAASQPDAATA